MTTLTRILLIRHGETEWNRVEVFRGHRDVPLGERGREQARRIAARLRETRLAAVYSSPLLRAVQTARWIAAGTEVRIAEGLTDMSFGAWEGLPRREVEARWPHLYAVWQTRPQDFQALGGESLEAVRARALPALESIARAHPDQAVAVVSHRVVNKVLLCAVTGVDLGRFWQVRQDTGCINTLEWADGRWTVRQANDLSHLRGLTPDRRDF